MVHIHPIDLDGYTCVAIVVELPKTRLIAIQTDKGYIMCGALDVALLNTRLQNRHIIAGRAVGVRTVEELLTAPLESVTDSAVELGVHVGMRGKDALLLMR